MTWSEDYQCGCVSAEVPRKRDLLGYCYRHGHDRRRVWHTEADPPALKVKMNPAVIPPYPKADEPGGIGWATNMRVFDVDIDNDIDQKEEPKP